MANYQSVKPIGQIDNYACWAACLSWWTKAMNRANKKTQIELIKIYDNGLLTDGNGAIMPSALESYVFPAFSLKLQKVNKDESLGVAGLCSAWSHSVLQGAGESNYKELAA